MAKKTKLYTGGTGCGKTYKAITEAKDFVIAGPCRQLAYEMFCDYPTISCIDTGEVHLGNRGGNRVCIYESLPLGVIPQKTLIIDEAHYINDEDRGGMLFEKIMINKRARKEIILLTATDTLSREVKKILQVVECVVPPFRKPPKKIEIDIATFCTKVRAGMSAIVFTKYVPREDEVCAYARQFGLDRTVIGVISADTTSFERVQTQLDFKSGKLPVVISTNVLAQGLNFPAQGVLIEYNEHDDWEIITQKVGRVARPLTGMREGYYTLREIPKKVQSVGLPVKVERRAFFYERPGGEVLSIADWGFMVHEVPENVLSYKYYKYGFRFLRELLKRTGHLEDGEGLALQFLEEQHTLLSELLSKRPTEAEPAALPA